MKFSSALSVILVATVLFACSKGYDPNEWLTPQEQYDNMWKAVRYFGRAPENLTMQERFYNGYDNHYKEQMKAHRIDAYYIDGNTHYLLVSRMAPSLTEKRVAIAIKMTLDNKDEVSDYEEVFRTWKMPDTLQVRRSIMLFDKMVKGESLDPYLIKNSEPEEYIEFPDETTYFDKTERIWKRKSSL